MLLDTEQIITRVRQKVLDPAGAAQGNSFTDEHILAALELAFGEMVGMALEAAQGYYEVVRDLNLSAGVDSYPLFDDFLQLRLAERQPGGAVMAESRKREGAPFGAYQLTPAEHVYALFGDSFRMDPTPAAAESPGVKLFIVAEPPPPLKGTAQAGGATSITLATSAPDVDDQLNDSQIRIVSGPGAGDRRRITDYAGSSRVSTVSAAWSTNPTSVSVYATIPRLPSLFLPRLAHGAAMHLRDNLEMDSRAERDHWTKTLEDWADFLETRTQAPVAEGVFDPYDGHC